MITCLDGWNTHQKWRNLEASMLIHAYTNSAVIVMGVGTLKWSCIKSLFDTGIFIQSFIHSFIPQLPGPPTWIQLAMPSHPPIHFPPERPQWLHQAVQGLDKGTHLQCCPGSVLQSWIRTGIFWQILTSSNRKDWMPTTNCNPRLQHAAQKKIGMSADGSVSGSWNSALISLATKFMSHAPSDRTSGM